MGHSKGGDLAASSAVLLNDIFGLAIVNSCLPNAPVLVDTSYSGRVIKNAGMTPELFFEHAIAGDDGICQLESGLWQTTGNEFGPCFTKNQNGEYSLNYDCFKYIKGTVVTCDSC